MSIGESEGDSLWYKDAILYELHVRAFFDSNGDGIGDFRGLTEKLDYLQDLGVTALWLLPFYPSPLKDDGYDIADYTGVHPNYGDLRDFRVFLREAHRRGLRVITELVINHTSDQHPWFQRARRAPRGSSYRNYYVWSDTPDRYAEARIIFKDFEHSNWAWDHVAQQYYWHRFYSHQPDLNYDNPEVKRAVFQVMDYWFRMGVDGMRLDAIPYLYEREGTNCENLPETHALLKELRRHVDAHFADRMLLAEANQWPEEAVAYFGAGDECHMAFHFPVMPRLFMAIRMEDRFPIIDILNQTPPIPETCQWALFLRNHDELTLEMVTDEERDYMYRVYAQDRTARINLGIRRRLAPLLANNRRRIELMNGLLFSLPGTPVIYYGDEIGMGDNVYLGDRNGVRTPMQWSADRNAGFSRANPQRLYLPLIVDPEYHYESVNVEAQQNNPQSLLWWMKRLIALRKQFRAFGRGTIEFLYPANRKVLAFVRRYEDETILVVANLSRFAQYVELDLRPFQGSIPVEVFGRTPFPRIGELPYLLTLGPHSFYWFTIEPERVPEIGGDGRAARVPNLAIAADWTELLDAPARARLEAALPGYLQARRWFGGKARRLKGTRIVETIDLPTTAPRAVIALVQADYTEGDPELYVLPLACADGDRADRLRQTQPHLVIAELRRRGQADGPAAALYDALGEPAVAEVLLEAIGRRRRLRGASGEVVGAPTAAFRDLRGPSGAPLEPRLLGAEQSNSSLLFGDRLVLKLYRKLEEGVSPELELNRYLSEQVGFAHVPPLAGALEYRRDRAEPMTLAILQGFVPNEGDAWRYTLDELGAYFERALARVHAPDEVPLLPRQPLLALVEAECPPEVGEVIGSYLELARLLGQRTAELHLALARPTEDPSFAPEPFTTLYQRSLYQSLRSLKSRVFQLLREQPALLREQQALAETVLARQAAIEERFRLLLDRKFAAVRIRTHGDYHLGQVLFTGRDFVIIDFEGEPARPLGERRLKRSPLRDVAGMLRSFHYAAATALAGPAESVNIRPADRAVLEPWARLWQTWVAATFLRAYLATVGDAPLVPPSRQETAALLDAFLLEKAIYELGYELNNRPTWAAIPLSGILQLLETAPTPAAPVG